jgi:1A family penicillin-binding protein
MRFYFLFCLFLMSALIPAQANFATCPIQPSGIASSSVVDRHGRYVGRILPQKRYWVSINNIPIFLQKAIIAVEDSRFYEHDGIDVYGIARAMFKNVVNGRLVEGGSTITQQLIKNKYLTGKASLDRKVKEARMAIEFERKYTKRQILEMYFNEIYYGNGATGIAQAARFYFNKSPSELTEGECILLAGVPKNPNRYNPMGKPEDVTRRRDIVLKRMVDLRIITPNKRYYLQTHPIVVQKCDHAPQYLSQVRTRLVESMGFEAVEYGGLEITAALDLTLQQQAEQVLREGTKKIDPDLQGALICIDPINGDVLAAVGDTTGAKNSINRVFTSRRQPGSAIKPLIYAAAVEKGITASSMWSDAPVTYNWGNGSTWRPLNFGKVNHGDLSLRQALAYSSNTITVKLLDLIGVPYFIGIAGKMGLPMQAKNGLSLALGTDEVTLGNLVQAYIPLANNGLRVESRTVIRVRNKRYGTCTECQPVITAALSPATAYIVTQMLKDVMTYGTAKSLIRFGREHASAGKTGTTNNYLDTWFVGYTPQLLTGVWVGYDRPKPIGGGLTGGAVAAPIWERFMIKNAKPKSAVDFTKPSGIASAAIDPTTGHLATATCPKKQDEFYISGTEPRTSCTKHTAEQLIAITPNANG